jgi:alpha-tubulin suppressor-like RCC1 family protein
MSRLIAVDKGEVYVWGGNAEDQLGFGPKYGPQYVELVPKLVLLPQFRIVQISAGSSHTMALTGGIIGNLW